MAIPINEDPYSTTTLMMWCSIEDLSSENLSYRPESLESICEMTKFTKREIQLLYRSFKQGCPSGIVSLQQFQEIFAQFFPQCSSRRYAELVFRTLDRDADNQISFQEFVVGLSALTRGTQEDKLNWVFSLYDTHRRDLIGLSELLQVTQAMYELLNRRCAVTKGHIVEHVWQIFKKLCPDPGETNIARDRFVEICLNDKDICDSLDLFHTVL
ncbi:kv channel-interacting protein 4 [Ditylenchus destructor]|uniref:Kv channel-interacting protein 4 n=1 Tax=Ditylenchus destructor TaxID=166010 RepID=A0AAD4NL13_9BILA|nr:kv channel-interacting protein 4 [Ditylenchus destructor]